MAAHTLPHFPQLVGSVAGFTQSLPQKVVPPGHVVASGPTEASIGGGGGPPSSVPLATVHESLPSTHEPSLALDVHGIARELEPDAVRSTVKVAAEQDDPGLSVNVAMQVDGSTVPTIGAVGSPPPTMGTLIVACVPATSSTADPPESSAHDAVGKQVST